MLKTGVAINSGHAGNSGNRVIGLASRDVMKNFEAEHFARDSEQIDHFLIASGVFLARNSGWNDHRMIKNRRFLIGAACLLFGVKTYTKTPIFFAVKTGRDFSFPTCIPVHSTTRGL